MISCVAMKKSFGGEAVLRDVSFSIGEGERVSLIGPGGCGKTTILKALLGLVGLDGGQALLMDTDLGTAKKRIRQSVQRNVGVAFQQGALFDFMTVRENLLFAMEHMTKLTESEREQKMRIMLDGVKLARAANQFPFELSGGMQRRVGVARALAIDPRIAIFDEPTSGLDPVTSTIILNMISALGGDGGQRTLMIVTTNVEIGIRFGKRVIVIHEGIVAADGPWRELLLNGPDWVRHFLGTRLIGLDRAYAEGLDLPPAFLKEHWT